ncbi:putative MFS transporter [Glonium stellatum]|uniref:Putative MFS transporter n=1 Tax=Glonium stellatum TaxID=574774 RepID=A0A8E2EXP4_9PEZI|nr:putative MFS transporter [Glonium stellatum]
MDEKAMVNQKIESRDGVQVSSNENSVDTEITARRILLTIDTRVLPALALLFLRSVLDRTNVGNAKILGLEKDIGIIDHQYNTGLAVFYATYIASELPSNLVIKKILYMSTFYKRNKMALRIGLFHTASSLLGTFGGLLARGLSAIGLRGGLEGWRWIFIIEGLLIGKIFHGVISFLILPNTLESASFLTSEERAVARQRVVQDMSTTSDHSSVECRETFQWSEVRRGILNIQVWLSTLAYFAILSGPYSFGLFLPTIINALTFASNPNNAQLWSVIPYAVATVVTIAIAILSDRMRLKGVIILFTLPISIVGYAVIASIASAKTKYGMTFLMTTGLYSSVPCILVWNSNNSAGHYKRTTISALQLAIANNGGFVAIHVSSICVCSAMATNPRNRVLFNVLHCAKINRDKAKGKYDAYKGCRDDRDPEFKMVL